MPENPKLSALRAKLKKKTETSANAGMSSSEIRLKLRSVLRTIKETKKPIDIRMDGKVIGQLTLDRPSYKVSPLPIKIVDAQKFWSELLTYVWISGARYVFSVRFEEDEPAEKIYLFRPESATKNVFQEPWHEHRSKFTPHESSPVSISEMQEIIDLLRKDLEKHIHEMNEFTQAKLEHLSNKVGTAFATNNRRNGDLLATPEMGIEPLRSIKDFDSGKSSD